MTKDLRPRLFWRRTFGYLADLFWMTAVFSFLFWAINLVSPVRFLEPSFFNLEQCWTIDKYSEEYIRNLFVADANAAVSQTMCKQKRMLLFDVYSVTLANERQEGNKRLTTYVSFFADEAGNKIDAVDPSIWILGFPAVMAWLLAKRGRTPGKGLLRLAVTNEVNNFPSTQQALRRELLKNLPLMLFGVYSTLTSIYLYGRSIEDLAAVLPKEGFAPLYVLIGGSAAISIVFIWFTFGSFIRWRGQTYWDRFAGTRVELT